VNIGRTQIVAAGQDFLVAWPVHGQLCRETPIIAAAEKA